MGMGDVINLADYRLRKQRAAAWYQLRDWLEEVAYGRTIGVDLASGPDRTIYAFLAKARQDIIDITGIKNLPPT